MYLVYVIYLAESGPSCGRQDLCSLACGILFFSPNIYLFVYLDALGLSCGMWDLVPWPGIEPSPAALGAYSLNHWTTREVLKGVDFKVMVNARCRWNVDVSRSYSGWKDEFEWRKRERNSHLSSSWSQKKGGAWGHACLYTWTSFQKWRPLYVTDTLFRLNLNKAYTVLFQFTYINVSPKCSLFF